MTPKPLHPFESKLTEAWPPGAWCDSHVVLAVSAGADSVAMLRAVAAVKERFGGRGEVIVAHLNHGLRGADSDTDESWLKSLCHRLNVPLEIGRADVSAMAATRGDGLEAAARDARYHFLEHAAEKRGARYLATAHTADDQVETVLHRILRGTGLAGLAGIPVGRPLSASVALVRPLLAVWRTEVLNYLDAIGQDFRVDSSNTDTRWTRNRLRHELLPMLRKQYNAAVEDALLRLASQAGEAQQVIAHLAGELAGKSVTAYLPPGAKSNEPAAGVEIDCRALKDSPPLLVREVCKVAWQTAGWSEQAIGYHQWHQLAELIQGTNAAPANLPGNIRARRQKDTLVLERLE